MYNRKQLPHYILVLFMFIFSVLIAWCVPYTDDDWDWGRSIGIANWLSGTYNNRFVGTFFVIIMTRSRILKTLIMAVVMTSLPLLCAYLAIRSDAPPKNRIFLYVLTYFVVFAMPVITWRQTYGWVAGFSNFSMGAFFLLAILAFLKYILHSQIKHHCALCAGSFLLGFVAQLCAENISFFFPFFLVAAMCLTRVWQHRQQRMIFFATLLGAILGTALMFFNPLYVNLATTGVSTEQFRSLNFSPEDPIFSILRTIIAVFLRVTLPNLYETHPILVLFLTVGVWLDLFPKYRTSAIWLCLPMFLYGISCCWCAWNMRQDPNWLPVSAQLRTIGSVCFTGLWLLSALLSSSRSKWHTLFLSLFAIALITPFAVISNMGPRCYHISHFLLLAAGASHYDGVSFRLPAKVVISAALALTIASLAQAYAAIGTCNLIRQELIEQAQQTQAEKLVLPTVDGRYTYSWGYNPQVAARAEHYREFYGLPEDIELVFLPYGTAELWPEIPDELYAQALIYP